MCNGRAQYISFDIASKRVYYAGIPTSMGTDERGMTRGIPSLAVRMCRHVRPCIRTHLRRSTGTTAVSATQTQPREVLDLVSQTVVGNAGPTSSYLGAVTDDTIVTRTQTSVVAFDFAGQEQWRFDAAEVRGPIAAVKDGVLLAYALRYDVQTTSGPYADCFDHITGHGVSGLVSTASVSSTSYHACIGVGATAAGRLAIKTDANYNQLANNPLTDRTIFFDRRPVGGTWTLDVTSATATNVSGNNWSKTFSNGGAATYEFRVRYTGETGVDASNQLTFTIKWSTAC
jgi:hypothetical protein